MTANANPVWQQLRNAGSVWIDDPDGSTLYLAPREVLSADNPADLAQLLVRADAALDAGLYVAGFFSYDTGPDDFAVPGAWLGVYDSAVQVGEPDFAAFDYSFQAAARNEHELHDRFTRAAGTVKSLIEAGVVYQVNITALLRFLFEGDALSLYLRLRQLQRGRYAAFINTGALHVLSVSPELFLSASPADPAVPGALQLETRPMKGTVSAGRSAESLRSPKNLSENHMIVDLMRNDLGRICIPGTVKVAAAAEITALPTALQMTSTVRGILPPGPFFSRVMPAAFPPGSITGAPKTSAMRIIEQLEEHRGLYTGTIGHAGRGRARFNVAIRTLALQNGRGLYGSGCGIVWESEAEDEYAEFQLKASFLIPALDDFRLIETMRMNGVIVCLRPHLRRLEQSAGAFAIPFSRRRVLEALVPLRGKQARVRLTLNRKGEVFVDTSPLPLRRSVLLGFSDRRVDSGDLYRRHKTTHRALYDAGLKDANNRGLDDAVFLNERGEVVETSIRNILLRTGFGKWLTPPLASGALPGVHLAMLERMHPGRIERAVLFPEDLRQGRLYVVNSVRGLERAHIAFSGHTPPTPEWVDVGGGKNDPPTGPAAS